MNKILELLKPALNAGVEISVYTNEDQELCVNVNTAAKSECILQELENGQVWAYGRYGRNEEVLDFWELCCFVNDGKCGRDYISSAWQDALDNEGF